MTDIKTLTANTILHYHQSAEDFWQGTRDHDVSQNINAMCRHLPEGEKRLLDFGCGPGRDLMTFTKMGYTAIGLDGATDLCEMARKHSGCEVWQQDFVNLTLPAKFFAGIFANATLFHTPRSELVGLLNHFHTSLVDNGVVFCSNPRGPDLEQVNELRYGNYMELEGWRTAFKTTGFEECEHYYRPPGRPRDEQPWLAMVWRKVD